jgi:hypothetical protein
MKKAVKHSLDLSNPLPWTKKQMTEFKALSELPDNKIDYSGIQPLPAEFWKQATPNPSYKSTKTSPSFLC